MDLYIRQGFIVNVEYNMNKVITPSNKVILFLTTFNLTFAILLENSLKVLFFNLLQVFAPVQ